MLERLQKIISRSGITSRRHAEQLILSGAVTVNGRVITELGTKADAGRDHITVGPRAVRLEAGAREGYFAFNKPAQVVSTVNDPEGRPCLGPYLRGFRGRLFPVGRLEFDAAGLLVLTSDGELASDLMRAAGAITQTWRVKVKGRLPEAARQAVEREAHARMRIYRDAANAWYEATLRNAPRDLLRQSLVRQGILVEKLVRSGYGGVELEALAPGEMRELTAEEVNRLRRASQGRMEPERERPGRNQPGQEKPRRHGRGGDGRSAQPRGELAEAVVQWRSTHRASGKSRRHSRSSPRQAGAPRKGRVHNRPGGRGRE